MRNPNRPFTHPQIHLSHPFKIFIPLKNFPHFPPAHFSLNFISPKKSAPAVAVHKPLPAPPAASTPPQLAPPTPSYPPPHCQAAPAPSGHPAPPYGLPAPNPAARHPRPRSAVDVRPPCPARISKHKGNEGEVSGSFVIVNRDSGDHSDGDLDAEGKKLDPKSKLENEEIRAKEEEDLVNDDEKLSEENGSGSDMKVEEGKEVEAGEKLDFDVQLVREEVEGDPFKIFVPPQKRHPSPPLSFLTKFHQPPSSA